MAKRVVEKMLANGTRVLEVKDTLHYGKDGTIMQSAEESYWPLRHATPEDTDSVAKLREVLEQEQDQLAEALEFLDSFDDAANPWETMVPDYV